MATLKKIFPWAFLVFLAFGILFPNPFGNNPDVITDESYFLTSSLNAIEKHTLPGWEFSPSGAYYGGIQTYVDTAVMVPAVAIVLAHTHFSPAAAKVWIAVNTGELLHLLRLVNGAFALAALAFCYWYFKKRAIPKELALTLCTFLSLTLSNVLVIEFLHTAKMWGFYVVFVPVTGAFFITQEYYLRVLGRPLLSHERYTAFLLWSGALTFFQSYVGAFTILLYGIYALILAQISSQDVWRHIKKYWYLFIALAITQISFIYRAYEMSGQISGVSTRTASGALDWHARIFAPILYAVQSQPLSLLYVLGVVMAVGLIFSRHAAIANMRKRKYLLIACAHPILIYFFFYIGIGFDLTPRYAILLTLACSFSATILLSEIDRRAAAVALSAGAVLFCIINIHAIALYWRPSSETELLGTITMRYNTARNVFITDHSARRMTLPVNDASLPYLDEERADMSRYNYLLQNPDLLSAMVSFKPIVMTAYVDSEERADIARFATSTEDVWIISSSCDNFCSASESAAGTCFEVHIDTCDILPQEVNTLPDFLRADELGYPYVVRRVH